MGKMKDLWAEQRQREAVDLMQLLGRTPPVKNCKYSIKISYGGIEQDNPLYLEYETYTAALPVFSMLTYLTPSRAVQLELREVQVFGVKILNTVEVNV